jgi:hypothetical protein
MSIDSEARIPDAPTGIRQHDYLVGWRACEASVERDWSTLVEQAEYGATLAERYGEAMIRISQALNDDALKDAGKIARVRLIIASLDPSR